MRINVLRPIALSATLITGQAQAALYYFHNDHLGTPQVVTDTSGDVVWEGHYSPFGEVEEATALVQQDLRFPGQLLDRETGLHYNYFRDYDPQTGRYTTSDPIGLGGGLTTFEYTYSNPIVNYDEKGLAVSYMCRPLDGVLGYVAKHCFVFVECPQENWAVTLSLFGSDFASVGEKEAIFSDNPIFGSRDDPNSGSITDNIKIDPPSEMCGECSFEKSVLEEYNRFPSGPVPYFPLGPNSNTFAQTLINNAGGSWGGNGVSFAPGMRR